MLLTIINIVLSLVFAYLIGAIPTAFIFAKILKGVDIRKYGSGNVGATNAFRVLGKVPGVVVLIIDIAKGLICTTFLADFASLPQMDMDIWRIVLGVVAVAGHNWTLFLRFKGGKGIATSLGVLIGLAVKIAGIRIILALLVAIWLAIFFLFGFVSLASIIAGICLPIFMLLFSQSFALVCLGVVFCLFVVFRHKANIRRLLNREEPRVSFSLFKRKRFP